MPGAALTALARQAEEGAGDAGRASLARPPCAGRRRAGCQRGLPPQSVLRRTTWASASVSACVMVSSDEVAPSRWK